MKHRPCRPTGSDPHLTTIQSFRLSKLLEGEKSIDAVHVAKKHLTHFSMMRTGRNKNDKLLKVGNVHLGVPPPDADTVAAILSSARRRSWWRRTATSAGTTFPSTVHRSLSPF